jgi:hypothetical protein
MASHRQRATAIRALSMDAVQQANSGHPGAPMGMARMVNLPLAFTTVSLRMAKEMDRVYTQRNTVSVTKVSGRITNTRVKAAILLALAQTHTLVSGRVASWNTGVIRGMASSSSEAN